LNRIAKNIGVYIIILVLVMAITWVYQGNQGPQIKEVEFSDFVRYIQNKQVKELTIIETSLLGTLKSGEKVSAYAPSAVELMLLSEKHIFPQIEEGTLVLTSEKPSSTSWILSILPTAVMILIFVLFWFVFMHQVQWQSPDGDESRAYLCMYES
jgi:cell division protease FtsH